jgi:hypothetical protein
MFMRILRRLGVLFVALIAVAGSAVVAARFSDGPMGILAGGSLVSGGLVTGAEPDWTFARDIPTIEFQLLEPARSRTTWILVHEGNAYIVSLYMDSAMGRLWKQWPIEAERDGRAVIRVDGKRYERQLVRIKSGPIVEALTAELNRKYGVPATPKTVAADSIWLFELKPRA